MSPVIRIPDEIFKRLQKLATPLIDTPATVISRLLDEHENDLVKMKTSVNVNTELSLDPESPGDLSHTKIINARLGSYNAKDWKDLVILAHKTAIRELDLNRVKSITISNVADKKINDKGFHYYPDLGLSIQGENANKSWQSAFTIAKYLKTEIEVSFNWRMNRKAIHPGSKGYLIWKP